MVHEVNDGLEGYARELRTGLTNDFLEAIVILLRRNSWDILRLEDAVARLERGDPRRRFAVLTFDDGYRDTLTRALPVLERYAAPFTVYVPTGAVTRQLHSWWLGLRAVFQQHDRVAIAPMETCFDSSHLSGKIEALRKVSEWVHADYRRTTALDDTFRRYHVSLSELNDVYFLTESQLCELACHPLVTIGAHTETHSAMSLLEPAAVREELVRNRHYLEHLTDRGVFDLAYPYGGALACSEREFAIAAETGFRSGVTTRYGPVFPSDRDRVHALPRVAADGTFHVDGFASTVASLRNITP